MNDLLRSPVNGLRPLDLIRTYDVDQTRYCILPYVAFGMDGDQALPNRVAALPGQRRKEINVQELHHALDVICDVARSGNGWVDEKDL